MARACAVGSGALLVLTYMYRDWIEAVLGVDADGHGGALEWMISVALFAIAAVAAALARYERTQIVARAREHALALLVAKGDEHAQIEEVRC